MTTLNKFQERMLECALEYATERGWHVMPVSKNKRPIIKEWSKKATTDEKQIIKWWLEFKSCNIGVLTGPESGIWVVDIDNKPEFNGLVNLANYFGDKFIFNVNDYIAGKTPTDGMHLVFEWDPNHPVKTTSNILRGVDTRGVGGQFVVPPSSRHLGDKWIEYRWNDWDLPVSPIEGWAYDIIRMAGERTDNKKAVDLSKISQGLQEGERDEQLNKVAWMFKSHDVQYDLAVALVMAAAERCNPPFDPELAKDKVYRAYTTDVTPQDSIAKFIQEKFKGNQ